MRPVEFIIKEGNEHFSTNSDIVTLALTSLQSVAALRAGKSPGRQRQSGKTGVPSKERVATTSAHGDAGPDLYGFQDQLPCTADAFVLRSLQSLGGTLAESLSEFYDACHVGGKTRGYFRHDPWTIS